MKPLLIPVFIVMLFFSVCFADEKPVLNNLDDKISYSVGYQMGSDFKRQSLDIKPETFLKGIQDALAGIKPLIKQQEMNKILIDLKRKVVAAQKEEQRKAAVKNLAEGEAFLAKNKQKEGVKILPSGLQYKVIKDGTGATPKATDQVKVHYRGTLINGTEFDSSYGLGRPATFRADQVIPGWKEALQLMKEGAKWQLFIPPNLAYGERSAGAKIGPNSTLIFEVELISVLHSN